MSLASKLTLGAAALTMVGIVYCVQAKQVEDINKMHEGVIRDRERRKAENLNLLQQQEELAKALRQRSDDEVVLQILADKQNEND